MVSGLSSIAVIVHIRRYPRNGKPSHYAWTMEHDGEYVDGGGDLESIQACLVDMASGLPGTTAIIKFVYLDVPVGSFSAGACIEVPQEIAEVERHFLIRNLNTCKK